MEFVLEVIVCFLLEGLLDIITNNKIKPIYRKIILVIITLLYTSIIGALIIASINTNSLVAKLFCIMVIGLLVFLLTKIWIKVFKNEPFDS